MPSLHAGLALFVVTYAILRLRSPWRWALLMYPLAMSFALVYYAEHYVVDILAGFVAVVVVLVGWNSWERRRARPRGAPADIDGVGWENQYWSAVPPENDRIDHSNRAPSTRTAAER